MPLTNPDLKQIKGAVTEAVDPYFGAIQKDFNNVYNRFDKIDNGLERIEKLLIADHHQRIEKLEVEIKELKELLAIK